MCLTVWSLMPARERLTRWWTFLVMFQLRASQMKILLHVVAALGHRIIPPLLAPLLPDANRIERV
jgi:hypothetical protein